MLASRVVLVPLHGRFRPANQSRTNMLFVRLELIREPHHYVTEYVCMRLPRNTSANFITATAAENVCLQLLSRLQLNPNTTGPTNRCCLPWFVQTVNTSTYFFMLLFKKKKAVGLLTLFVSQKRTSDSALIWVHKCVQMVQKWSAMDTSHCQQLDMLWRGRCGRSGAMALAC